VCFLETITKGLGSFATQDDRNFPATRQFDASEHQDAGLQFLVPVSILLLLLPGLRLCLCLLQEGQQERSVIM
jgi:hypothetical protein